MAIDGLCGWHSNHNVNVPWIEVVELSSVMTGTDAVEAVQVAALEAVIINTVGTKHNLPFGGYGLVGVCNDTAGLIQHSLEGTTNVYPLTFNGKFAMHNLRTARELRSNLCRQHILDCSSAIASVDRLIRAIASLSSDVNTMPAEAVNQCKRQLIGQPKLPPFALMLESAKIIQSILDELQNTK
jgi:hypothetical protein